MAPAAKKKKNLKTRRVTTRQAVVKHKDELITLEEKHNKECMFCGQKEISERSYGLLYQFNDIVVHYFCILLSSRAVQNGEDKDGILGFLIKDIKNELNRGSREICIYCKKNGATISCCEPRCRKIFHLPCGMANGSMHQFYQKFKSFCSQHRKAQVIDIADLQNSSPVECSICKQGIIPTPLPDSIWAPCCRRNAWFHRKCIQDLALSTGYFFKCPLCNNVEKFKSRMLYLGIYIPSRHYMKKIDHRDASWETVPNAFAELLERHNSCDATSCMCPHRDKRRFNQESGSWEIILCTTCGSSGTHKLCSSVKADQEWVCAECIELTELAKKRQTEKLKSNSSKTDRKSATISNTVTATVSNTVAINGTHRSRRIRDAPIINVEAHKAKRKRRNLEETRNMDIHCAASTSKGNQTATRNVGLFGANRHVESPEATRYSGSLGSTRNSGSFGSTRNSGSLGASRYAGSFEPTRYTESLEETGHFLPMMSTRESPRPNNNNRELNYRLIPSTSTSPPVPIVISDESNDSDVLLLKYVEPPKSTSKDNRKKQKDDMSLQYHYNYFPAIDDDPNYPKISDVGTLGEVAGNIAPRRFIANQLRDKSLLCVVTSHIDLTASDDENDIVDNDSNNNTTS